MKCWQKWEDAQITLLKKRETEAKMMVANKPDKIQQAKNEIREVINILFTQILCHSYMHNFSYFFLSHSALSYFSIVYELRDLVRSIYLQEPLFPHMTLT